MSTKETTRKELELALRRIQLGRPKVVAVDRKLSIAAVADEAGVSAALVHNSHPDFAEQVRGLTGKTPGAAAAKRHEKLAAMEAQVAELKAQLAARDEDLRKLAIQNLALSEENKQLRHGRGVVLPMKLGS